MDIFFDTFTKGKLVSFTGLYYNDTLKGHKSIEQLTEIYSIISWDLMLE